MAEMSNLQLSLRNVSLKDAEILFAWRNDVKTRMASRTGAELKWEDHLAWLESSLKNPKRVLVIAERKNIPVGTARADKRADGFTEISYTIAPEARGQGLSKPMVLQFVREFLKGRRITATIKKGHVPSESVARTLGLAPYSEKPSDNPADSQPMVEWR